MGREGIEPPGHVPATDSCDSVLVYTAIGTDLMLCFLSVDIKSFPHLPIFSWLWSTCLAGNCLITLSNMARYNLKFQKLLIVLFYFS